MRINQKLAVMLGTLMTAPALLAEGEQSNSYDFTAAGTELENMTTAVKQWIVNNAPKVGIILGAAMIIMLIFAAFRWIKKGTSKAS